MRAQNTLALGLKGTGTHVVTTLTTTKLEPEQQQDPNLDLLTGFQVLFSFKVGRYIGSRKNTVTNMVKDDRIRESTAYRMFIVFYRIFLRPNMWAKFG